MPDAALGKAGRAACHPCYLRRRRPALARQARSSRIYPEFGLPRLGRRELRITSVFSCVARGFKARASFRFTGCCWWRLLIVDGGSGTSGGHAWGTPEAHVVSGCLRPVDVQSPVAVMVPIANCLSGHRLAVVRCGEDG